MAINLRITLSTLAVIALSISLNGSGLAQEPWPLTREEQNVRTATTVLNEVMALPAEAIPEALLRRAQGVAIVPGVVKGGFVVGVRHGRGVVLLRDEAGVWQPPQFVTLTGGSFGWQVGIQSTDVILVFRTRKSLTGLMEGKLTLGVDAAAAAGPVGRNAAAATDGRLQAEIFSYSRSRGLFAGLALDGSVLQVDHMAGQTYYRQWQVGPDGQLQQTPGVVPASAIGLINTLAAFTGAPQVMAPEAHDAGAAGDANGWLGIPNQRYRSQPAQTEPTYANQPLAATAAQLQTAHSRLATLLPAPWQSYLTIPEFRQPSDGQVELLPWQETLARYDAVAGDSRYRALTMRPEFAETHQLLRQFVQRVATQRQQLSLPPPPGR